MDEKMIIKRKLAALYAASGREDFLALTIKEGKYLLSRIKELEDQVLRMIRGEFKQICCYCGWESKEGQWEELQAHLKECTQHPLKQALDRIKELEGDLKLNSSLLAKQTDLARESEIKLAEARRKIKELEEKKKWRGKK